MRGGFVDVLKNVVDACFKIFKGLVEFRLHSFEF